MEKLEKLERLAPKPAPWGTERPRRRSAAVCAASSSTS